MDSKITNSDSRNVLVAKDYVDGLLAGMYPTKRLVGENPTCPERYYSQQRNYDSRICKDSYGLTNPAYGVADYCGRKVVTETCTTAGGWNPSICTHPVYCCGSTYSNHTYWHTVTGTRGLTCITNTWSENECVLTESEDDYIILRQGVEKKISDDCVAVGGEMVMAGSDGFICRFKGATCPANWIQYKNWSTTNTGYGACSVSTGYHVTGAHLWANIVRETAGDAIAVIVEIGCY